MIPSVATSEIGKAQTLCFAQGNSKNKNLNILSTNILNNNQCSKLQFSELLEIGKLDI